MAFTKTGGWDTSVMAPGKFTWRWERLLPTNMKLYIFTLTPQTVTVSAQGSLPSSDIYKTLLENNADFSYSYDFALRFQIRPESLPAAVSGDSLRPDTLSDWYESFRITCVNEASAIIKRTYNQSLPDKGVSVSDLEEILLSSLSVRFPHVQILGITPLKINLPDEDLYRAVKNQYLTLLETRTAALNRITELSINQRSSETARLEVLKQYGELLTAYPILLEYMALPESSR